MLSGRELAIDQNPNATGWVNQRIVYTHGIGVAMVPVNEVTSEGQPRLFIGNLPPQSVPGAPTITEPRIYFGERRVGLRRRRREAGRVRLSDRRGRPVRCGRHRDVLDGHDRREDRQHADAAALRTALPRPRPAHQRPGHREQPAPLPPLARGPPGPHRAVPAFRQGPVPGRRRDRAASSTSRTPTRPRTGSRTPRPSTRRPSSRPGSDRRASTTSATASRSPWTPTTARCTSTSRIRATRSSAPTRASSRRSSPRSTRCRPDLRDHLRVPEELFNVQTQVFGRYHVTDPQQFFRSDDLWTVPTGTTSEQTLPSEAYYVVMRMPGESERRVPAAPADGPERTGRT